MKFTDYILETFKIHGRAVLAAGKTIPTKKRQNPRRGNRNPFCGIVGPHRASRFVDGKRDGRRSHSSVKPFSRQRDQNPIVAGFGE